MWLKQVMLFSLYIIYGCMELWINRFLLQVYVYPLDYLGLHSFSHNKNSSFWPFYKNFILVVVVLLFVGCISIDSSKLCSFIC